MTKGSILIVEDEKSIARALEIILKKSGYEIYGKVESGEECLELITEIPPSLVIMDIVLKGKLNGIETAREIKKRFDVPVIYLTAFADDEILDKAKKTEPYAFMLKPFHEKDLLINVEISLYKQEMLKQNENLIKHFQEEVMTNCVKSTQIQTLLDASAMINSTLNISEIKTKTIEAAMAISGAEAASLLLIDELTDDLFFDVALGEKGDSIKNSHISKDDGIAGTAIQLDKPIIVNNAQSDPQFYNELDHDMSFVTRNIICIPIKSKDKMIGVLEAINKKNGDFNDEDKNLLNALANQIAIALDNANLYDRQKKIFYSIITALAETIDKKDMYTGGHSKRVKEYSVITGKAVGLNDYDMNRLELASILHDIGKIGITDKILKKESDLTSEEFELIKQHPVFGEEILKHIQDLTDIIPGIRHHHERFDGNGYPDQIKGLDIDITARIITIADAFDAMVSGRAYKNKIEPILALEEIKRCGGTQFDPDIANTFYDIFKKLL